ncbi:MAG: 5-formyltetrahydrofolate cyclo-ligase [Kiritimatiellaceae bacterium]|nr:5-formyltetrahydrofolate cyclo-ligase [Kiritimatiellaceae bacterium]
MMLKSELRNKIKSLQSACNPSDLEIESKSICSYLSSWFDSRDIQHVGIYMAMPNEINLSSFADRLLAQGRSVYAPKYIKVDMGYSFSEIKPNSILQIGKFNLPEPLGAPINLNQIQAILAPGLAFDSTGVRLGRGGGFYDRIFSTYRGIRIGICNQSRIIPNLPHDIWDQRVHWVCNEKDGMKECSEN